MLTFKVDENLPTEAAGLLAGAGHDAVTVGDQRMAGQPDTNVAAVCQREGRAFIAHPDADVDEISSDGVVQKQVVKRSGPGNEPPDERR